MGNTPSGQQRLVRHIGLGEGIALYVSAVLGAGVLVLPGQVASLAGPASLLSWAFACLISVPLAMMFVALARRYPDSGGIATYVREAFGATTGGVAGWLYFVAGSVGQTVVPLTAGYYVVQAIHLPQGWAYAIAALILTAAVGANLAGLKVSGRAQIALAAGVAVALTITIAIAAPHMRLAQLTPFTPHGVAPIGAAVTVLFFAFAGWEAVAQLVGEFTDADRDVPRAVIATIAVVSALYLGISAAVVLTGTYGSDRVDHIAIELLLEHAFGPLGSVGAALAATVISVGTTNAFIAGVARLGHSLATTGWLPRPAARITSGSVPVGGILTVSAIAYAGLVLALIFHWGTETIVIVPSTLVIAVYLLAAAAGARLLRGRARACALVTIALTVTVIPSAARHILIPLAVVVLALGIRCALGHDPTSTSSSIRRRCCRKRELG